MDLLSRFQEHIQKHLSFLQKKGKCLLAVSGGVDSMVLCDVLYGAGIDFAIAHCNFQLRGEESDRDEEVVKKASQKYGKAFFLQRFDTADYASQHKISIQEAARKLRYEWFISLAEKENFSYILTAHHANDNAETALMHFFRGTGLRGLTGIPEQQKNIVRPLLPFTKQELLRYAGEKGLAFAEDSSNASDKYTRNFFRNQLIPAAEKIFPHAQQNLNQSISHLKESLQILEEAITKKHEKLFSYSEQLKAITVAVAAINQLQPLQTWVYELFRVYGLQPAQVSELIKLLDADNGSYILTTEKRIIKHRNRLLITDIAASSAEVYVIQENEKQISFAGGELLITEEEGNENFKIPSSAQIFCADKKNIRYPLVLRRAKQGDYFYPLGMQKKKKLSRFFIDLKLSLPEKENMWVLESDQRIIWVVGKRPDDRFKIKPSTKQILKIELRML